MSEQELPIMIKQHLMWTCPSCGTQGERTIYQHNAEPDEVMCLGCTQLFCIQYRRPSVQALRILTPEEAEQRRKRGEVWGMMKVTYRGKAEPPKMILLDDFGADDKGDEDEPTPGAHHQATAR